MKIAYNQTGRGFQRIEFSDLYEAGCSLQKSSLADDDAVWFGINDADPQILAIDAPAFGIETDETTGWVPYPIPEQVSLTTRMHLNREQVAALLPALHHFVESGELPARPQPTAGDFVTGEQYARVVAERDLFYAATEEMHCKTCNTSFPPEASLDLKCKTPSCNGMLRPSSVSYRRLEQQLAQLRPQAEAAHKVAHAIGLAAGSDVTSKLAPAVAQLVKQRDDLLDAIRKALELSNGAGASLHCLLEGDASKAVRDAKDAMVHLRELNKTAISAITASKGGAA